MSTDSLKWVREQYGVPAYLGGKVIADGQPGEIRGTNGPHVLVLLEGDNVARPWHPTWHMTYLTGEAQA